MKTVSKSSFTLFELLIVILIISLLYGIFVQKLSHKESIRPQDRLKNLDAILAKYDFNESAEIVCINECKECFVQIDGKRVEDIELFDGSVKVYDYDIHGVLSQVQFTPIFDDENPKQVCFRYRLYPNKSHSSYIVEYKDKYYLYFAYMRPTEVYASISEAQKAFDPSQWVPTDSSEYNF